MRLITSLLLAALPCLSIAAKSRVSAAWYAGWHATDFPLDKVSWDKYTHLIYSFAETSPNIHALNLSGSDPSVLPKFVKKAHENNVAALVSIGGWTGSRFFSSALGSAANRTAFVQTVTTFAAKYQLDGLDFDWEYPGSQGIGCNTISSADTSNFLKFLKELRATSAGKKLFLTATGGVLPWVDASGAPSTSLKGFAAVLDYVAIMNYDVWGSWSATVGPNAPLNDTCAKPANEDGSAVSGAAAWSAAGIPVDQLVLGVAAYGHSFRVAHKDAYANGKSGALALYAPFNASAQPAGDAWDDTAGTDECGNYSGVGGLWDFWGLIKAGWLTTKGTPSKNIGYDYDACSQTPYVYNATSEVMVSYDNVQSFAAKGAFVKHAGLRGFAIWEAGGDYNDMLLNSIRGAIGF